MVDRTATLIRLAALAAAGDPNQSWISRLCEAGRLLANGRGASATLHSDEETRATVAATDELAARLESLQEVLLEGPCRQAYRGNRAVSADLRNGSEVLWPEFVRSARELAGDVVLHCYPMRPVALPIGVFSVYAAAGEITEPPEVLQHLADAVGAAALNDSTLLDSEGMWASRAVVHQAVGMLAAQFRVVPQDAMAILRAHAFAGSATVEAVALQIVQRRLDLRKDI